MTKRTISAMFAVLTVFTVGLGVSAQSEVKSSSDEAPGREIVMAVVNGRVRSAPNLKSTILKEAALGTKFIAVAAVKGWNEVKLGTSNGDGAAKTGWISMSITKPYDRAKPGVQFQKIVQRYFDRKVIRFGTARQLFEVLPSAADDAKTFEVGGDLRLKSLMALSAALKAMPYNKYESSPYKEFLTQYKNDVVYSEPAGEWYVRAERFWELHGKYATHKVGERIAWKAAANPIPGECEGYINCYLYLLRATQGEYLNFYPNGKYSKQALKNINGLLQPIVSDVRTKSTYYTTSDISDRAEFNKMLAELRKIVSRTPLVEKQAVLTQINQIAEGYR